MKFYTNNIGLIAQAKNMRMGLSYAKVSHASFLRRYAPDCPIRLKEVCYIEKGQTITEDDALPGSIPVVAGGKTLAYYHNASNRDGNVITISASGASSGFINYWNEPIWASDCITVKSKNEDKFLTKFIYHLLKIVQTDIYLLQQGADQPHVYPDDVKYICIPAVSVETQRKILSIVEEKENQIRKGIDCLQNEQTIIDIVFEREFKFNYDVFNDLKRRKVYFAKESLVGNNPDLRFSAKFHRDAGYYVMNQLTHITDKKIKHYLSEPIVLGASITPNDFSENGSAFYVSMATIKTLDIELDESQLISDEYYENNLDKSIKKQDIIMARSGVAIGKVAIVKKPFKGVFADFTMRIRIDKEKSDPEFVYYYFRSTYFQYLIEIYKKGLQNQNIFPVVIREFPMPDISLEEQHRIVDEIHTEIAKQDRIRAEIVNLRTEIDNYIENAITGESQSNE